MLRNYLLIPFRNFVRQPAYTLLNILGLTIGIVSTLFILLFITHEMGYDRHQEKLDRIYRISSDITEPDDAFRWAVTQRPLAQQLKQDYPEVEEYVRFIPNGRTRLEHREGEQSRFFFEEKVFLVDSTVCDIFSFDFLMGDANTALKAPNSIALSSSVANKIFAKRDPIGQILRTPSGREYKVTGVYRDMPVNSHLIANAMISSNSIPGFNNPNAGSWGGFNLYSYVLLREGADAKSFAAKLPEVIEKHVAVIFDEINIKVKYHLLPLADIHLTSDFEGEPEPVGQMGFLYIFGIVGIFMLLLACINYMNLATTRATKRSMEVGIRKVLGSERRQLIAQFLTESILFTVIALVLSYIMVLILLPLFNATFELSLARSLLWSPTVLLSLFGLILLVGILGGSYPAFYLSGFRPLVVLKGSLAQGSGNPRLRQSLVAIQFAITIFMLVGTGIIYDQMNYLRNKNLGFDKEHVLTFSLQGRQNRERFPIIKDKLLQNPKIVNVATATTTPGDGFGKQIMKLEAGDGSMKTLGVDNYGVDFDFFPTLGVDFVHGRNFSPSFTTDSTEAVLVNEAMVERLAWDDPIGRKVHIDGSDSSTVMQVVGVVNNFHQQSLYEPIAPLLFIPRFNNAQVHARISPQSATDLSSILSFVESQWQEVFPNEPFEYDFVDASFMELYKADQMRAYIFTLFSILMIVVACLGLLGLASFTAEQRTKEIGIRKVLGANTSSIVYLLTSNFVWLVALATVPAFLAAWYFMSKWLDTFSYHTYMNYWLFVLAFVIVVVITLLTTGYHAIRAAWSNPVEALKTE